MSEDMSRLKAVRDAVGHGFEIFTDANQAFSGDFRGACALLIDLSVVERAIRYARRMEELDIGY